MPNTLPANNRTWNICSDLDKIISWLLNSSPLTLIGTNLHCLDSGMASVKGSINCEDTEYVEQKIQAKSGNKNINVITIK